MATERDVNDQVIRHGVLLEQHAKEIEHVGLSLRELRNDVRSLADSVKSLMSMAESDRRLAKFGLAIAAAVFTAAQVAVQVIFR